MKRACTIMTSVGSPALQYFSTVSHKRHDLKKRSFIGSKTFVLIFCTNLSETVFILRRNERDMVIDVHLSSCKVPAIVRL